MPTEWIDPTAEIQPDFPMRAASVQRIQANITALAEGASGAPPVLPAAISADGAPAGATLVATAEGRFSAVPAGLALFDHFIGGAAVFHGWAIDTTWEYAHRYTAEPGVIRVSPGTTSCRGLAARLGDLSASSWSISARLNCSGFSGSSGRHMVGFMNINGDLNDGRPGGIYLMAREDVNSGNWFIFRRIPGGTMGNMDLSDIPVGGWQVLSCEHDATAGTLTFSVDGTVVASYDTAVVELPPWSSNYDPAVALGRHGTSGVAALDLDWISFRQA